MSIDDDNSTPGRATVRDANNTIRAATLSPETAREMAIERWSKAAKSAEETDALLVQMGYDDPATASAVDRLLAQKAASTGSVEALRLLLAQSGQLVRQASVSTGKLKGNDACPTCGTRPKIVIFLSDSAAQQIAAALAGRLNRE